MGYPHKNKRVYPRVDCRHCRKDFANTSIKRHEAKCHSNPAFIESDGIKCLMCETIFFNRPSERKVTCSHSCSNRHFRTGENHGNWNPDRYRSTCFAYHEKRCIVCGEEKIVAVHHFDEDRNNNDPANLIPLCPTHHQYCHSRYAELVMPTILEYLAQWQKAQI